MHFLEIPEETKMICFGNNLKSDKTNKGILFSNANYKTVSNHFIWPQFEEETFFKKK
jgi:hypothetical protein